MLSDQEFAGIRASAAAVQSRVVSVRREIHRFPELGNDTPRTRQTVLDALDGLGLRHSPVEVDERSCRSQRRYERRTNRSASW